MKQPIFIKNIPIDEKRIDFIERIVTRLARRAKKKTTVIIPPAIIPSCTFGEDISGCVTKALLFKGVVTKCIIKLGKKPKHPPTVKISVGHIAIFEALEKLQSDISIELQCDNGSEFSVDIIPADVENREPVTEVIVSALWIPDKQESEIRQLAIDSLEES